MDGCHRIIRPAAKAINTALPPGKALSFSFRETPGAGGADAVALDDLLGMSDTVMLHLPLTAETSNLLNGRHLALLRMSAYLINTGRHRR
jgi:phosphoglycerate dehydrogenase-like enzyme